MACIAVLMRDTDSWILLKEYDRHERDGRLFGSSVTVRHGVIVKKKISSATLSEFRVDHADNCDN